MNLKLSPKISSAILVASLAVSCASEPPVFQKVPTVESKLTVQRPVGQSFEIPELLSNEKIVEHAGYALSFDKANRVARWTAYRLTPEKNKSKNIERKNKFYTDPKVEQSPEPSDYEGSGYDRGHLVPAEDMRWSEASMKDSFYMSNMTPQTHKFNAGIWKKLETKVRAWASKYDEVFIVSGPVLTKECIKKIAASICVPVEFYKVILEKSGNKMRAIGFLIPHQFKINDLKAYAVSVRQVEGITKLNFFPQLSKADADKIETSKNISVWLN